jgi:hypothetical protein
MKLNPVTNITLSWERNDHHTRTYVMTGFCADGQLKMLGELEEGPFDTDLETARWAWRVITRTLALDSR